MERQRLGIDPDGSESGPADSVGSCLSHRRHACLGPFTPGWRLALPDGLWVSQQRVPPPAHTASPISAGGRKKNGPVCLIFLGFLA